MNINTTYSFIHRKYNLNDSVQVKRINNSIIASIIILFADLFMFIVNIFYPKPFGLLLIALVFLIVIVSIILTVSGYYRLSVDLLFVFNNTFITVITFLTSAGYIPFLDLHMPVYFPYIIAISSVLMIGWLAVHAYQIIVASILPVITSIIVTIIKIKGCCIQDVFSMFFIISLLILVAFFSFGVFTLLNNVKRAFADQEKLMEKLKLDYKMLEYTKNRATESEKAKSHFLSVLSHEIKTPLNSIVGFAEILKAENLTKEQNEFVNVISNSANSLLEMFSDLLSIVNLKNFSGTNLYTKIIVKELFIQITEKFKQKIAISGNNLIIEQSDDFPDIIFCDREKVRVILEQIISNSIKFTHNGTVILKCDLHRERNEGFYRFTIKDNGIGIPDDKLGMIFDHFMQADSSSTRKHDGLGIGLTIVKGFAHLLDGVVSISSKEGEFTIVTVLLPIKTEDQTSVG